MLKAQKNELENFDISSILRLDQKVTEQQVTLEQAGVAGFYATKNPTDIKVQMILLDFISQLEKKENNGELSSNNDIHSREESNPSESYQGYSSANSTNTWW